MRLAARGLRTFTAWLRARLRLSTAAGLLGVWACAAHAGNAYWLWAGIPATPKMLAADAVYIHQGQVRVAPSGQVRLVKLGMAPFPAAFHSAVLVYRLAALPAPAELIPALTTQAHAWERSGVQVSGVQIDFDASTLCLPGYAAFLHGLRLALPRQYALTVTGLADWSTTAPTGDLEAVADCVDEIDFQMYRGNKAVSDWERYARTLSRLRTPFRLGLLESMTPSPTLAEALAINPAYRGPIYFELRDLQHAAP